MKRKIEKDRTELQRLLSKRGFASRKRASELISKGLVQVNGRTVKDPSAYISVNAKITVEGLEVKDSSPSKRTLIAFHKPKGVVTTRSDEKGRKTVYDVLPEKYRNLNAVGRLDMASTGLLLFTDDNQLADFFLDPRNKIARRYVVTVRGEVLPSEIASIKKGIRDGADLLKAQDIELRKASGKESLLIVALVEGKNREIRRIFESIGHEVIKLKRIAFGDIELSDLEVGGVRVIKSSQL